MLGSGEISREAADPFLTGLALGGVITIASCQSVIELKKTTGLEGSDFGGMDVLTEAFFSQN